MKKISFLLTLMLLFSCGGDDEEKSNPSSEISIQANTGLLLPQFACREIFWEAEKLAEPIEIYNRFKGLPKNLPATEDYIANYCENTYGGLQKDPIDEVCACKADLSLQPVDSCVTDPFYDLSERFQYETPNHFFGRLVNEAQKEFRSEKDKIIRHYEIFADLLPTEKIRLPNHRQRKKYYEAKLSEWDDDDEDPIKLTYKETWKKLFENTRYMECALSLTADDNTSVLVTPLKKFEPTRKPVPQASFKGLYSLIRYDDPHYPVFGCQSTSYCLDGKLETARLNSATRVNFGQIRSLFGISSTNMPSDWDTWDHKTLYEYLWERDIRLKYPQLNNFSTYEKDRTLTRAINTQKSYLEDFGLPGHYEMPDEFESKWFALLNDLEIYLYQCGISFQGATPFMDYRRDCIGVKNMDFERKAMVTELLQKSLLMTEAASLAYLEGDLESANELFNLSSDLLEAAKTIATIGIDMTPLGKYKDLVEAFTGKSIIPNFDELSTIDRAFAAAGFLTAGSGALKAMSKFLPKSVIVKSSEALEHFSKTIVDILDHGKKAISNLTENFALTTKEKIKEVFQPIIDNFGIPCTLAINQHSPKSFFKSIPSLFVGTAYASEKWPCSSELLNSLSNTISEIAIKSNLPKELYDDFSELVSKVPSAISESLAASLKVVSEVDESVKARALQRVSEYGSSWGKTNINDVVKKFAGTTPIIYGTDTGKILYRNPNTGIEVVHDYHGKYFRIIDTNLTGRRKALDLDGNLPNNKTLPDGRTIGRSKAEYEQVTHFNLE